MTIINGQLTLLGQGAARDVFAIAVDSNEIVADPLSASNGVYSLDLGSVITSYSIHYTKLYDEIIENDLQKRKLNFESVFLPVTFNSLIYMFTVFHNFF